MTGLTPTSPGGRIVTNYGTTTLVNNTTATRTMTVPAGRRWTFMGGQVYNADNVIRIIDVRVRDAAANVLSILLTYSCPATSYCSYLNTAASNLNLQSWGLVLDAGWTILITWTAGGASAGGTATSSFLVLEVPT